MFRAGIITASDKGAAGEREDLSGPAIREMLEETGAYTVTRSVILPDWTPEATLDVCQRMVPGIPEAMRAMSMQITPRAMLSRSAAGIRERTLIVNLPGSPKAARESLGFILPALGHGLDILAGVAGECAR